MLLGFNVSLLYDFCHFLVIHFVFWCHFLFNKSIYLGNQTLSLSFYLSLLYNNLVQVLLETPNYTERKHAPELRTYRAVCDVQEIGKLRHKY